MKRVNVLISGRVQGVFFRAFVNRRAHDLGLKGRVSNTSDGKVEAIFEGSPQKVDEMIKLCRQGPPAAKVEKVIVKKEEYKGDFTRFEIIY